MKDRLVPLLALVSFVGLGWVGGFAYPGVSKPVGTVLGLVAGVAYVVWYLRSEHWTPITQ